MTLLFNVPFACSDTALPVLSNGDAYLTGSNDGVKTLVDFSNPLCWAGGNPTNGATVNNLVPATAGLTWSINGTWTFSGNGMDTSALTSSNRVSHLVIPNSHLASLATNQEFLTMLYIKTPTQARWNTDSGLYEYFTLGGLYTTAPQLCTFGQMYSTGRTTARRQNAATTADNAFGALNANEFDTLVQMACWRKGTNFVHTVRTVAGGLRTIGTIGSTVLNPSSFAAITGKMGVYNTVWAGPANTDPPKPQAMKYYRFAIEDLFVSGRDPATVLAEDWARVVAANKFT